MVYKVFYAFYFFIFCLHQKYLGVILLEIFYNWISASMLSAKTLCQILYIIYTVKGLTVTCLLDNNLDLLLFLLNVLVLVSFYSFYSSYGF